MRDEWLTSCRDLPPKGGYAPIRYKRNLPARGPNAVFALFTMLGISAYGFYRIGQGNIERRCVLRTTRPCQHRC